HGPMPSVILVFPNTTVGGSSTGTARGRSSFWYGFFDGAVAWLEVVLADGKITRASKQRNPDLLSSMLGVLGTIGITTLF
ncbi:uncharacterized protein BDR25DRAFT_236204, partial [Lindgomyces ingoldianus]